MNFLRRRGVLHTMCICLHGCVLGSVTLRHTVRAHRCLSEGYGRVASRHRCFGGETCS
jgi:hypothetical protein